MSASICHNGIEHNSPLSTLLSSFDEVCQEVKPLKEDKAFLSQLLWNKAFQSLLFVYDKVQHLKFPPSYHDALRLSKDVKNLLQSSASYEGSELSHLLGKPHIEALFGAHDQVARKEFLPPLPDVPFEVDEDDESVKVVQLIKNTEPLGATIKIDEASDAVVVSRIVSGSVADRSGLINVGDELREVNGVRVKGKSPHDILNILTQCKEGTITFKLVPGVPPKSVPLQEVRANFSYDPCLDPDIPNKDKGLAYGRGDVLHVIDQEDPDWWTARLENNSKLGIIPSISLQRRRMSSACQNGSFCIKKEYSSDFWGETDSIGLLAYEEVSLLFPTPGLYRPIILIGAPGVGRNELKQRLLAHDPVHFKTTVPYTSRPPKPWEEEGKDYYFVSRDIIEEGITSGKFIEFGEYRGNLYGTSLDTIFAIMRSGRACILNPHPSALKLLCSTELKPYVIFVKAPSFELLKETRTKADAQSSYDENYSRCFTEKEFQDIIDNSWRIERMHGHKFDTVVVNEEINDTVKELLRIVRSVEVEAQWAPLEWTILP